MGQLGLPEMIIIGIIALLIFGPKKLPDLGSGLGKAIRDFKSAMSEPEQPAKDEKAKDEKAKDEQAKDQKKEEAVTKS
jgi:sec-independent protein translocase protein TatA